MAVNDTSFLVSYLAHEMRQPLYGIRSTLAELNSEEDAVLADCVTEIDRLLQFLNQTLSYMKDPEQNPLLQFGCFTLQHLLRRVQTVFASLARERGITFEINSEASPYPYLYGDENIIFQIFSNLLMNAFKFTPDYGKIQCKIQVCVLEEDRVRLSVYIADSGSGMSKEVLEKAFVPYESRESRLLPGTGLGLPIVQKLVEILKGKFEVQSKEGEGTTVFVELDLDASEEKYEVERGSQMQTQTAKLADLKDIKILIAENDEAIMESVAQTLHKAGAKVDKTYDGFEVVDLFEASEIGEYQLILMDLEMPELDGVTAAHMIRQMKRADAVAIPIFAYTGHFFLNEESFLQENGFQGILAKNVTPEELTNKVAEQLR